MIPPKLQKGDMVRVIAPSDAHTADNTSELIRLAQAKLESLGLKVTYGEHTDEIDEFKSSSIESRISDLHAAFADNDVKMVMASDGGWIANQLLRYIDWDLIRNNPKIFAGFSDITALNNSIYAKTGLVTYSAPLFCYFPLKGGDEYMFDYLQKCLFSHEPYEIEPSKRWRNDKWWGRESNPEWHENKGWLVINEGEAEGVSLGGNQCTLNLLQGTEYMPDLKDSILFLEDDYEVLPKTFDRDLQSLIHLPNFSGVRGILIGRFERASKMEDHLLTEIIKRKKELDHLPVIANVDFGHTDPKITFPVGGTVRMKASATGSSITV
ncbi:MAG TPA: S66 peptidase family protein, partial [Patescibacteria group bacterium]|nr:S66 peptidase family protein [Patescibacteria group bacterium]